MQYVKHHLFWGFDPSIPVQSELRLHSLIHDMWLSTFHWCVVPAQPPAVAQFERVRRGHLQVAVRRGRVRARCCRIDHAANVPGCGLLVEVSEIEPSGEIFHGEITLPLHSTSSYEYL